MPPTKLYDIYNDNIGMLCGELTLRDYSTYIPLREWLHDGDKVTCWIYSDYIEDARISIVGDKYYICQNFKDGNYTANKFGYKYSWNFQDDGCGGFTDEVRELKKVDSGDITIKGTGSICRVDYGHTEKSPEHAPIKLITKNFLIVEGN